MARVLSVPVRNYQLGSRSFGPVTLPDGVSSITVSVTRCTSATPTIFSDPASKISIEIEASFDGGATWVSGGEFEALGGVHMRHDGSEGAASSATWTWPPGSGRRLRGSVTVSGSTIRTALTVEVV